MSEKKIIDWEAVEREYRAGVLSLREISANHPGANHVAIARKAKNEGWEKNLSAKIKAKAEALVTKRDVTGDVTENRRVTERQMVDASAEVMVRVIRGHHKALARLDSVISLLFERLEEELKGGELFSQLGEMMAAPDEKGADKLGDLYRKVVALPSQTDTAKKLAETLKTKIELERKVFKIEDQQSDASEHMREFMEYLSGTSSRLPVSG